MRDDNETCWALCVYACIIIFLAGTSSMLSQLPSMKMEMPLGLGSSDATIFNALQHVDVANDDLIEVLDRVNSDGVPASDVFEYFRLHNHFHLAKEEIIVYRSNGKSVLINFALPSTIEVELVPVTWKVVSSVSGFE
jgi:hypothetical protein